MPTFQRKTIRQAIGIVRLRELTLGTTKLAVAAGTFVNVYDFNFANLDLSGQSLYQGAWLRVASVDYRVGSFNFQSGAWVSAQLAQNAIPSGADFEVHQRLSATEIDLCIDEAIKKVRIEQEVCIQGVDGAQIYAIDGAASPHTISDVGNVYFFANAASTTNRDRRDFTQFSPVMTATGREIRLESAQLGASQQLVLDALLEPTLLSPDTATLNLMNDDWIQWGATAEAYNMLIQKAPGQDSTLLEKRRAEAARQFTKLSERRQAIMARRNMFDAPVSGESRTYPGQLNDF